MAGRSRWTVDEARAWSAVQPWLIGCNFIPSTAVNQLEMWQDATFDAAAIDRELRWAGQLGFNTARVFLHDLLWAQDRDGFLRRIDRFLEIAASHGIRPLLVLFDGVWDPRPKIGPQPAPKPRVHNSGWVQSPGAAILSDSSNQDDLKGYVKGVITRFRDDARVLGWDLFNEPDNPNPAYAQYELANKAAAALTLLKKAFRWARQPAPEQPLTAGVWRGNWDLQHASAIDHVMLTESDVISFHCYEPTERLQKRIDELERLERPLLLTEYLARAMGSTFESVLPLLKERHVAAYNWGFVAGKTQTIYPWDSWTRTYAAEPPVWFHDIVRPDGTPYRAAETKLILDVTAK